jgi:hypothetical protein
MIILYARGGVKSYTKSQIADIVKKHFTPKNEKNYGYKIMTTNNSIESRVKGHLRENARLPKQLNWLDALYRECADNKHNLLIIIPPVRQDLRIAFSQASGNKDLFEDIKALKLSNVYNFYDDKDFQYDDFVDCDHLNDKGAKKLTLKINSLLNKTIFIDARSR